MAEQKFTASQSAIAVIAGNPGLSFSSAQLQAIARGSLVLNSLTDFGPKCITHLRYQNDSKDLQQLTLSDGTRFTVDGTPGSTKVVNLQDFQERLQEAANFGHGITFCVNREKDAMVMLNIYPCRCTCDKRD